MPEIITQASPLCRKRYPTFRILLMYVHIRKSLTSHSLSHSTWQPSNIRLNEPTGIQNHAPSVAPNPALSPQAALQQEFFRFTRSEDGRELTYNEVRMKAIQLKHDIHTDNQRLQEMVVDPNSPEAIDQYRALLARTQGKEIIRTRAMQVLAYNQSFHHWSQQGSFYMANGYRTWEPPGAEQCLNCVR